MPDKEGSEDKTTKSVVAKKQKQMMGEEGYDIARDMGRVRPSKDKKDATTMPVSDEVKKTRKINKGPSALELVKKKYKGQIMDELDLSKVAEAFGGYIVEQPVSGGDKKDKEAAEKAAKMSKKRGEFSKSFGKDPDIKTTQKPERVTNKMAKTFAKQDIEKTGDKFAGGSKSGPRKKKGIKFGEAPGAGPVKIIQPAKTQTSTTSAMSGSKVKGTPKGPTLKPTTSGRKIVKKMSKSEADEVIKRIDAKSDSRRDAQSDAKEAGRRFQRDFKPKGRGPKGTPVEGPTGDIGFNAPDRVKKIKKRETRAIKQGTPDPFTTPTPKKPIRPFGDKPVAGGMKFPPTVATSTRRDGVRKIYREPVGPGGSTVPKPPKRTPIPKDTGSLTDAPKVKKRFSQMSKDIKALKTDIKVDKDIEKNIARVDRGKKISKGADFSKVSRKTGAMKSGPKVVKQLGRNPKLGGSVVKVVGKETKKAAAKTAAKQVTKTAAKKALQKGVAKSAAKAIPGLGSVIAGVEAGARALKGDFKGAALSAGEAIPGVGLGFAGANIARDVSKAKKAASTVKTISKAKRVKDAVKVVTPTVVGSRADKIGQAKKGISNFAKTPAGKIAGIGGGVLTTSNLKKAKPENIKVQSVKGGKTGFRSAKS